MSLSNPLDIKFIESPESKLGIDDKEESRLSSIDIDKQQDKDMARLSISSESHLEGQWLAFVIFFVLGVGNLLPWNAFITASNYYQARFCGTSFEKSFESFFSMFYTISQPLGLIATIIFKKRVTTKSLVLYPLLIYTGIFVLTTVLVLISSVPATGLFAITLFSTFACGLCGAIMNGGLFGLSGILPAKFTGAIMSGQGLAGTSVSVVSIVILAIGSRTCVTDDDGTSNNNDNCDDQHVDYGAFAYFLVACAALCTCVILFMRLLKLEYVRHFMRLHLREHIMGSVQQHNPLLAGASAIPPSSSESSLLAFLYSSNNGSTGQNYVLPAARKSVSDIVVEEESYQLSTSMIPTVQPVKVSDIHVTAGEVWRIFRKIFIPALSVFSVFAGTLAVYPAVLVLINSQDNDCATTSNRLYGDLWMPFLFVLMNLSDFLGRISAPYFHQMTSVVNANTIWIPAMGRLLIPIFLCLTNITDSSLPVITKSNEVVMVLTVLLGFTNGSTANLAMMLGPELVEAEDASLAGTIMIFFLSAGLLGGSCLSFLLLYLLIGVA